MVVRRTGGWVGKRRPAGSWIATTWIPAAVPARVAARLISARDARFVGVERVGWVAALTTNPPHASKKKA
jgi:hypothetical protein